MFVCAFVYGELKRKAGDERQNDCLMPEIILHAYIIGMG